MLIKKEFCNVFTGFITNVTQDKTVQFLSITFNKEMSKAQVSYEEVVGCTPEEVRAGKVPSLTGYQEIECHLIFDVKMDFTRKARFVAGGHMTETPVSICYSSVVSRDSVRLAFLVAALNDLDILSCDIGNAYLNAPCREKIWFKAGIECGRSLQGKVMRLVRALYGLKSSGASWRHMFKTFIGNQDYSTCSRGSLHTQTFTMKKTDIVRLVMLHGKLVIRKLSVITKVVE